MTSQQGACGSHSFFDVSTDFSDETKLFESAEACVRNVLRCLRGNNRNRFGYNLKERLRNHFKIFSVLLLRLSRSKLRWVKLIPTTHGKLRHAGD